MKILSLVLTLFLLFSCGKELGVDENISVTEPSELLVSRTPQRSMVNLNSTNGTCGVYPNKESYRGGKLVKCYVKNGRVLEGSYVYIQKKGSTGQVGATHPCRLRNLVSPTVFECELGSPDPGIYDVIISNNGERLTMPDSLVLYYKGGRYDEGCAEHLAFPSGPYAETVNGSAEFGITTYALCAVPPVSMRSTDGLGVLEKTSASGFNLIKPSTEYVGRLNFIATDATGKEVPIYISIKDYRDFE